MLTRYKELHLITKNDFRGRLYVGSSEAIAAQSLVANGLDLVWAVVRWNIKQPTDEAVRRMVC